MTAEPLQFEAPSGKGAGDENFPVGSLLLAAALRPHVARFYAFARAIDDIADNPNLTATEKLDRLGAMKKALCGEIPAGTPGLEKADAIRESLVETGVPTRHCEDLISAFEQDSVKGRYADWDELIDYCNRSAAPVGRYLLDLHGENRSGYVHSDALCNALQVINHLQDCADDLAQIDRVYLPEDWLREAGTDISALRAPKASAELRRVLDRCLDRTEQLLLEARRLPGALASRRLALESAVIVKIAERLNRRLRVRDPVAERVELTKAEFLGCGLSGVLWVLLSKARVR